MSDIEKFNLESAPAPKGAYSQVVRAGDFLFVSGQGPIDAETDELVLGTIESETLLTLQNLAKILEGCGASQNNIVKCSVFLADEKDFAAMNAEYAKFFTNAAPARTTVGVKMVEPRMKIEIDCVAYLPQSK